MKKYYNVLFWIALFGIIFYFVIDSRDLKRGIKNFKDDVITPIDNKISDLVEGKTPEEIIKGSILSNETEILYIEATKQYFCDPGFSVINFCKKINSNITYTKTPLSKGDVCEEDFLIKYTKIKIQSYGQGKEKSQESCNAISEDFENKIYTLNLENEEFELVLSEERGREYIKNIKEEIEAGKISEPNSVKKYLIRLAKNKTTSGSDKSEAEARLIEKAKAKNIKEIIEAWYQSERDNVNFGDQINQSLNDNDISAKLCEQMIRESLEAIDKYNYIFRNSYEDTFSEICGVDSSNIFENTIRELIS